MRYEICSLTLNSGALVFGLQAAADVTHACFKPLSKKRHCSSTSIQEGIPVMLESLFNFKA